MQKGEAQIIYEPRIDAYKLNFEPNWHNPNHKNYIDAIKGLIPVSDRSYDPKTYTWLFQPKWYTLVAQLTQATFTKVYTFTKEQHEEYNRASVGGRIIPTSDYIGRFNETLRQLGIHDSNIDENTELSVAAKLYRRMALALHPDRNPNNSDAAEKMSKLNEAWANIKDNLKKESVTI